MSRGDRMSVATNGGTLMRLVVRTAATAGMGLLALSACSKTNEQTNEPPPPPPPGVVGNGDIGLVQPVANSEMFASPFDGVPDPDGVNIYFTALVQGEEQPIAAILKVPSTGGEPTTIASGDPLVAPYGIMISTDGQTLY